MATSDHFEIQNAIVYPKDFKLPFKVFKDSEKHCMMLAQPEDQTNRSNKRKRGTKKYPIVSVMSEDAKNEFALHIMLTINHKNILSMRTILDPHINGNTSLIVEEYSGVLKQVLSNVIFDPYQNIPSKRFQKIVREVIEAVDFLRVNNLYHGNLNWDAVLHNCYMVKLAHFKEKEDSVTLQEAQWNDWLGFLAMLEYILKIASTAYKDPNQHRKVFLGELEVLIRILKGSDTSKLGTIKDSLLDNAFFWDSDKRAEIFICTLPKFLKAKDKAFLESVEDSEICDLPWYGADVASLSEGVSDDILEANKDFCELVIEMNEYQDPSTPFDPKKKIDFLEFFSGGYTHVHELKLDVDSIL